MTLWVYDNDGRLHRLTDEFYPPVYAHGARAKPKQLGADLSKHGLIIGVRWVQKREFWRGDEIEVLQLNVSDSLHLSKLRQIAAELDREIAFYNLDIPTPQATLGTRQRCRVNSWAARQQGELEISDSKELRRRG